MSELHPAAPTVGEIARRLQVPLHRVQYVIRSRGISPTTRAGNIRVFSESDVRRIGRELDRISAERNIDPSGTLSKSDDAYSPTPIRALKTTQKPKKEPNE